MFISKFEDIQRIFDLKEVEGSYLDYKSIEYQFIKKTGISDDIRRKKKHELLKDVCGFLNSNGGTIVLGIDEDKDGFPKGDTMSSGLEILNLPSKYAEEIEHVILTGINPPPQVIIQTIENINDLEKCFIAINIPQQPYPLFSVIKDDSAEERNELYVRRGRINSFLSVREIVDRISRYELQNSKSLDKFYKIKKRFVKSNQQDAILLMYAVPLAPDYNYDVFSDEKIQDLLRGKLANQLKDFPVTVDLTNQFPFPIFEGSRITKGRRSLEVWERGNVIFQANLEKLGYVEKFIVRNDDDTGIMSGNHFLLNPSCIKGYFTNFLRFVVSFYQATNYYGDISLAFCIVPSDSLYAYRTNDGWSEHTINSQHQNTFKQFPGLKIPYENILSYYGPRGTEKDEITLIRRINIPSFSISNLDDADTFIKNKVLDYVWRAFTYETFP